MLGLFFLSGVAVAQTLLSQVPSAALSFASTSSFMITASPTLSTNANINYQFIEDPTAWNPAFTYSPVTLPNIPQGPAVDGSTSSIVANAQRSLTAPSGPTTLTLLPLLPGDAVIPQHTSRPAEHNSTSSNIFAQSSLVPFVNAGFSVRPDVLAGLAALACAVFI